MPISRARINKQKGFTLIELLLSLAIIGFIVAVGVPKLGKSLGSQVRATTRRMVILNREIHYSARLKGRTYRLVIQFPNPEKKTGSRLFVESGSSHELMADPSATPEATPSSSSDEKAPAPPFTPDQDILKKPIELPRGVVWENVELENSPKPVTEGVAYIYFFSQGLIEKAIIHITDGKKLHWSLVINPLTGDTAVIEDYIKLKDTDG